MKRVVISRGYPSCFQKPVFITVSGEPSHHSIPQINPPGLQVHSNQWTFQTYVVGTHNVSIPSHPLLQKDGSWISMERWRPSSQLQTWGTPPYSCQGMPLWHFRLIAMLCFPYPNTADFGFFFCWHRSLLLQVGRREGKYFTTALHGTVSFLALLSRLDGLLHIFPLVFSECCKFVSASMVRKV